ncbi:6,7-dimethyl-8-ribityllumazine synthase [Paracoccus salsus]|uniref:6,7-dimethyl-8-ribityllumazine synthase n=1 Tax=Paracoccus salsus TaxID=2911061 RepID=UPI001F02620C|nr:6,7-dimethyl-8-ribityllumazine synthase [Paracoccus salsus]MCF3974449.1 6,7-dimethyl-8-ribityllumazine synthase [Paracoccus salsus]
MASNTQHHLLELPHLDAPVRLLAVIAPYYKAIADGLLAGARATADTAGAVLDVVEVPGALEIPTAVAIAARRSGYDGFVALGCVIRGETTHYDTVCNDSSRGLTLLGLQGVCIGNGILTVETIDQAEVRADPEGQNKGGGATAAALHLVALSRKWASRRDPGSPPNDPDPVRLAGRLEGQGNA